MGIILKSNLNTNLKIANMFDNVGVKFQKFWFSSFLVIEQSSRLSVKPSYFILYSIIYLLFDKYYGNDVLYFQM